MISNLIPGYKYKFRIQAVSELGLSPFSEVTEEACGISEEQTDPSMKIVLGVIASALVTFCLIMIVFVFYGKFDNCNQRWKGKDPNFRFRP